MNSRLYRGTVWHRRGEPDYSFSYAVWYLSLDLAEIDRVASKLHLLSHNRHNVVSFWDRDYRALEEAVVSPPPEPSRSIQLLTTPRILGHAFNPVSFFLERKDGAIAGVHAEVHNTWSERHVYTLTNRGPDGRYIAEAAKAFYVSPFLPMEAHYRFELQEEDGGRLRIKIEDYDEAGRWIFGSGIDVRPMQLSDANLVRLLLSLPLVGLKTVAMIHWQGVMLWSRGVKFRPNPSRKTKGSSTWPRGH